MNINTEKKLIKEVTLSHETERKSFETKMKVRKSSGILKMIIHWQRFGSGFNWVSGSGSGSRPIEIRPRKRKNEENSCLKSPNVLCMGFKKTYGSWQFLIKKIFQLKIFFLSNFVIINLGLDPDPDLDWIRIQQKAGSRSRFSKIPGSGFSEYGSETLSLDWLVGLVCTSAFFCLNKEIDFYN